MDELREVPLELQLYALAFRQAGAIKTFSEELAPSTLEGGPQGYYEFYQALLDFYDKTQLDPIDPIAFRSWLDTETDIHANLGGVPGVSIFLDTIGKVELAKPESVMALLHYQATKRKQRESLQELQLLLSTKKRKSEEDKDRISKLTDTIRSLEQDVGYDPTAVIRTANDMAEGAEQLWDLPDFISTQFKSLNIALGYTENGGFVRGGICSIIANSAFGKSTLAKSLCNHWLDQGYSVLFVNFEEPQAHWERVLMTQVVGKNIYRGAGEDDKERYTKLFKEKMYEWGDRLMVRHDPETQYFDDLERWMRDLIGHNATLPEVVVIDTIQSMFLKNSQRWGQFEEMMVRLEKLAKDMNCVMIVTSQQNNNALKEKREVLTQADAGGSVAIIQKSTIALFITRKFRADEAGDPNIMEIQIPKNRITGTIFVSQPPLIKYEDETKSYVPFDLVTDGDYPTDTFEDLYEEYQF